MSKKCKECGHTAKHHYVSDAEVSKGRVICSKDNCTAWNRCDQKGWKKEELLGKN